MAGIRVGHRALAGLIAGVYSAFFLVPCQADHPVVEATFPSPVEEPRDATTIDADHLIELYQDVPSLLIVDSRISGDYLLGHIETSINLPLENTDCKALGKLANSPEQAIVFYSNNNAGDASVEAIKIASQCGYRRLFWLNGGFDEWKARDYPYVIE